MATQRSQPRSQAQDDRQKPEHSIRLRNIRAAIWKNETDQGVRFNVTVSRFYKDGDNWKNSDSFGRDDLLVVAKVLEDCFCWICAESQNDAPI